MGWVDVESHSLRLNTVSKLNASSGLTLSSGARRDNIEWGPGLSKFESSVYLVDALREWPEFNECTFPPFRLMVSLWEVIV